MDTDRVKNVIQTRHTLLEDGCDLDLILVNDVQLLKVLSILSDQIRNTLDTEGNFN